MANAGETISIYIRSNEEIKEAPQTILSLPNGDDIDLDMNKSEDWEVSYNIPDNIEGEASITSSAYDMADNKGTDDVSFTIVIPNRPPKFETIGNIIIEEGKQMDISIPFSDPDENDFHTATINWGDGTSEETVEVVGENMSVKASHTYIDNNIYHISTSIVDSNNETDSLNFEVNVVNANPEISADQVSITAEKGEEIQIFQTFYDSGVEDTHTVIIDFGDSCSDSGIINQEINQVTGSHVYNNKGSYTVTLTITDDDQGIVKKDIMIISVNNTSPVTENDHIETVEDKQVTGILNAKDEDNDDLVYSIVEEPEKGVIELDLKTGSYSYIPDSNMNGNDSFTYKVNDGESDSNISTISIHIEPVIKLYTITGKVHYSGQQMGELFISTNKQNTEAENPLYEQIHTWDTATENTSFTIAVENGDYTINAFLDSNYSAKWEKGEPKTYSDEHVSINSMDSTPCEIWICIKGDVNNNNQVTAQDAIDAFHLLFEPDAWTKDLMCRADFNNNSIITAQDAIDIFKSSF